MLEDPMLTVRNLTTGTISEFHIAMLTISHFRSLALAARNATTVPAGLARPPADLGPWVAFPGLDEAVTPSVQCPGPNTFWQVGR